MPDANAVTVDDYVEDTREWVKVIRETTGTDCVWLLGTAKVALSSWPSLKWTIRFAG